MHYLNANICEYCKFIYFQLSLHCMFHVTFWRGSNSYRSWDSRCDVAIRVMPRFFLLSLSIPNHGVAPLHQPIWMESSGKQHVNKTMIPVLLFHDSNRKRNKSTSWNLKTNHHFFAQRTSFSLGSENAPNVFLGW